MQEPPSDFLCCDWSEAANEPMYGTAFHADVWLMLEYTRPWGAKATSENDLPQAVQRWLDEQVEKFNGRLQFIRKFRPEMDGLTFFIGAAGRLFRFELVRYEDLLGLDITAVLRGDPQFATQQVSEKHYFICTNGKRDRSCAVRGAATYRSFAEQASENVWMTTHLGGHRFAPTLLSLPDGFCYGRIHPEDVARFQNIQAQGDVWLEKLRGQTAYGAVEQAADYFLRQETGQLAEGAFVLLDCVAENGRWQVQFQNRIGQALTVVIASADPLSIYPNSNNPEMKAVPQHQLVDITTG